jgi:hypothetical protein
MIGVVCLPHTVNLLAAVDDCLREWPSNAIFLLSRIPTGTDANARVDIAKSCSDRIPDIVQSCKEQNAWRRLYCGEAQQKILGDIRIMKDEVDYSEEFAKLSQEIMKNSSQRFEYATIVSSGAHEAETSVLAACSLLVFPTPTEAFYPRHKISEAIYLMESAAEVAPRLPQLIRNWANWIGSFVFSDKPIEDN